MVEKKQWGLRVEEQLIDRLNRLAPKAGYSSGNELAADALNIFAETLVDCIIELRKVERATVDRQREQLLAKIRQLQVSGTDLDRRK